jgi:hypothetical protein
MYTTWTATLIQYTAKHVLSLSKTKTFVTPFLFTHRWKLFRKYFRTCFQMKTALDSDMFVIHMQYPVYRAKVVDYCNICLSNVQCVSACNKSFSKKPKRFVRNFGWLKCIAINKSNPINMQCLQCSQKLCVGIVEVPPTKQ